MATTNWESAESFQELCPHTFNALQHLVVSMAKAQNTKGKRSFFGRDKGLAAYSVFEDKLRDTILAMSLDSLILRNSPSSEIRERLCQAIGLFSTAFPNWQDAYSFAHENFVSSEATAISLIDIAKR